MTWPEVVAVAVVMGGFVGIAWAMAWMEVRGAKRTDEILRGLREPTWKVTTKPKKRGDE